MIDMTKLEELIKSAKEIKTNELPQSNTALLVGTHLEGVNEVLKTLDNELEKKTSALEQKSEAANADIKNINDILDFELTLTDITTSGYIQPYRIDGTTNKVAKSGTSTNLRTYYLSAQDTDKNYQIEVKKSSSTSYAVGLFGYIDSNNTDDIIGADVKDVKGVYDKTTNSDDAIFVPSGKILVVSTFGSVSTISIKEVNKGSKTLNDKAEKDDIKRLDQEILLAKQSIKPLTSTFLIKPTSSHSSNNDKIIASIPKGTEMRIEINSLGGKYSSTTPLYLFYADGTTATNTVYCDRVKTIVAEKDIVALGLYLAAGKATEEGYISLSVGVEGNVLDIIRNPKSIFDLFPQYEYSPKVATISKKSSTLHLMWFSDIHGDTTNMGRINEWKNKYSEYVDDVLNTGDTLYQRYDTNYDTHIIPYFEQYGGSNMLMLVGNHDVANSGTYAWTTLPISEIYDKYMSKMNDAELGISRPSGNRCYYYKDYADKGIRLIVTDSVITDASYVSEQLTWFEEVLESAKSSGLTVVAASHYTPHSYTSLDNGRGFTSYKDYTNSGYDEIDDRFLAIVDSFISSGGKFATWLVGHVHCDLIGKITNHQNQLVIGVTTASQDRGDVAEINPSRLRNTKTNDAFNHIGINSTTGTITILRIGYEFDSLGREIKMISVDYNNKVVL